MQAAYFRICVSWIVPHRIGILFVAVCDDTVLAFPCVFALFLAYIPVPGYFTCLIILLSADYISKYT